MDGIIEAFKTGGKVELQAACDWIVLAWKDVDVVPLLALREQLSKLGLEQRAARLEEALICIAEKKAEPFLALMRNPENILWRPAVEALSMAGDPAAFDLLLGQLNACQPKALPDILAALGRYGDRSADAVAPFLKSEDYAVFYESVLALREAGEAGEERLREAHHDYRRSGSARASVIEAALKRRRAAG